jgi:hypothetical protein
MSLLRFASMLVLALWIGGLAVLAAAGPYVFEVLEARDPVNGRAMAGFVFGELVTRFQHWSWALAGGLLLLLGLRAFIGPRPRRFAIRTWTIAALLALSVAVGLYVTPRVEQIRNEANGRVTTLAESDPRRVEFATLHRLSILLMLLTLAAGVGLIFAEVHDGA